MDNSRKVSLTQGQVALIDTQDWPLVRAYSWHACRCGRNAWRAETTIRVHGRSTHIRLHRLLTGLESGDGKCVDHINGNGLDNRRCNLRVCTQHENLCNRRKFMESSTTSFYKGVSWHKLRSKWRAYIRVNGHAIHLGLFINEKEAARAYDQAAMTYFGEFARLNFGSQVAINDRIYRG